MTNVGEVEAKSNPLGYAKDNGIHGLILAEDSDDSAMRVFGEPPGHGFQLSLE